jgi:hypothetical protein
MQGISPGGEPVYERGVDQPRHRAGRERPVGSTAAGARAPGSAAPGNDAARLLALQRTAGNRAVQGIIGADAKRAGVVETRMEVVAQSASARGAAILVASDACVADLREAKKHLRDAAFNYRTAYDRYTQVLKRADREHEFDTSVSDAVQGILVATVLAVVLPEAIATGAAMAAARALVGSTSAGLTRAGLMIARTAMSPVVGAAGDAAAGEVAEMATGAALTGLRPDPGRPSDSADLAGESATDKFALVLTHLDRLITALPALGGVGNSQRDVGLAASRLSTLAVKLRAGDPIGMTADVLADKAGVIDDLDRAGAGAMPMIGQSINRMLILKNQALAVRVQPPTVIEDQLWIRWMASLTGNDANEALDNDVLEKYLGPNGRRMFDFGRYTSDSDQGEAVTAAQRRWLVSQGIEPGPNGSVTLSKFKGHKRLEEIRNAVTGRTGRLTTPTTIEIDGQRYDYPRNAGTLPVGTEMTALHVIIKPLLQGDVLIDRWTNDDFDIYCNPVEPARVAAPGAPGPGRP